jgi:hypothetical protein
MNVSKSPGGSMYPYYYKGGEVHCLKYGSFLKDHDRLFALMKEEERFVQSTNKQLRIWIDMYETKITKEVLFELVQSLHRMNNHILKLTIVGLSLYSRWRLNKLIHRNKFTELNVKYFVDPEDAKTWLVSE